MNPYTIGGGEGGISIYLFLQLLGHLHFQKRPQFSQERIWGHTFPIFLQGVEKRVVRWRSIIQQIPHPVRTGCLASYPWNLFGTIPVAEEWWSVQIKVEEVLFWFVYKDIISTIRHKVYLKQFIDFKLINISMLVQSKQNPPQKKI